MFHFELKNFNVKTVLSNKIKSKSTALCKATTKETGLIDIHPTFKHVVRCPKQLLF